MSGLRYIIVESDGYLYCTNLRPLSKDFSWFLFRKRIKNKFLLKINRIHILDAATFFHNYYRAGNILKLCILSTRDSIGVRGLSGGSDDWRFLTPIAPPELQGSSTLCWRRKKVQSFRNTSADAGPALVLRKDVPPPGIEPGQR